MKWLDLLTEYNGNAITYDKIGTRIEKTVADGETATTHKYYIQDGKIVAETRQNDNTLDKLEFIYDDTGAPFALIYNGTKYYYMTNLQGNVVKIINSSGSSVATYTYNAWGEVISGGGSKIGTVNPLRYRGYYYDSETGLYYLNSRYYDPATCRFINADGQINSSFLGLNLFAYCENNPVNMKDDDGDVAFLAILPLVPVAVKAIIVAVGAISAAAIVGTVASRIIYVAISRTHGKTSRPELKRQGREGSGKKKNKPGWKSNPNRKPRSQPGHHTPGNYHKKY